MDDRVGEILAQRAKLDRGMGAAIFFSIFLHATLSAFAAWAALHHAATTQETSLINIRLAQPQPTAEIAPPVTATQAPPPPKPIEQTKPKEKTAPPSPFGKSKRKPAEEVPPATRHPLPAPPAQPPAPEAPIGGSG